MFKSSLPVHLLVLIPLTGFLLEASGRHHHKHHEDYSGDDDDYDDYYDNKEQDERDEYENEIADDREKDYVISYQEWTYDAPTTMEPPPPPEICGTFMRKCNLRVDRCCKGYVCALLDGGGDEPMLPPRCYPYEPELINIRTAKRSRKRGYPVVLSTSPTTTDEPITDPSAKHARSLITTPLPRTPSTRKPLGQDRRERREQLMARVETTRLPKVTPSDT